MRTWKPLCLMLSLLACDGGARKEPDKEVKEGGGVDSASSKSNSAEELASGDFKTFTYSLANQPLSAKTVDRKRAQDAADNLAERTKKLSYEDRKEYMALMAARRFAGTPLSDIITMGTKLIAMEIKKDIKRELPEVAKLELVLSAIRVRKLSLAEYFIDQLKDSKNKSIKAAAFTAEGMIAILDGRLPEAVALWAEAARVDSDYEPALLNVGFMAMKYGDIGTARKYLTPRSGDYTVQTAMVAAERLGGNAARAEELCKSVLDKHKTYKPALFNCALNQLQGLNQVDEAEKTFKEMTKLPGGDTQGYGEKAERFLLKIEDDRRAKVEKEKKPPPAEKPAADKPTPEAAPAAADGTKTASPAPEAEKQPTK